LINLEDCSALEKFEKLDMIDKEAQNSLSAADNISAADVM
jgi:hypothetical protein